MEIWFLNRKQKTVLRIGIAVIVVMGIFPPTRRGYCPAVRIPAGIRHPGRPQEIIHYEPPHFGYTFLLIAKISDIGFGKLLVQWIMVAVVTGGSIYTFKDKKDNKKQKNCLWIGIAVIVLMGIIPPVDKGTNFFFAAKSEEIEYVKLFIQWIIVGAITVGLIYAFRDQKEKRLKADQNQ